MMREVKKFGNSSHIILPVSWEGKYVKVEIVEENEYTTPENMLAQCAKCFDERGNKREEK